MGYNLQQLKQCAAMICEGCGLSYEDAARVVGSFQGGAACGRVLAGDLSDVGPACDLLGITPPGASVGPVAASSDAAPVKHTERKQAARVKGTPPAKGKPGKQDRPAALLPDAERVEGDLVQETPAGDLPPIIAERVEGALSDFCQKYNIDDLSKERQPRWGAACVYVGQVVFRGSDLLKETGPGARSNVSGAAAYDVEKVRALVALWGFLCQLYSKAPFIDDFAHFAGVSDSWIYGAGRDQLTPARASLLKKLQMMQEAGLAGLIADGRQNPTGALAILNHWHNWVSVREVVHTDGSGERAAALPVFNLPTLPG